MVKVWLSLAEFKMVKVPDPPECGKPTPTLWDFAFRRTPRRALTWTCHFIHCLHFPRPEFVFQLFVFRKSKWGTNLTLLYR